MANIVPLPKGFLGLRIAQIIFALIIVGLTAFLISNTLGFVFSSTGFGIFCGILTLVIVTYDLVSEKAVQGAYNMWAVLALEIVMVLFWLSAMGSLAALRAAFSVYVDVYYKRSIEKRYVYAWAGDTYLAVLAATAGVAAIELILFIVSLVMFSVRLHRHRKSGRGASGSSTNLHGTVYVSPEKIELQNGGQAYQAPPQQSYPNYQPPVLQSQHTGSSGFTPVSPMQTGQPTTSPAPQYPAAGPPHGYHEAPGYHGV